MISVAFISSLDFFLNWILGICEQELSDVDKLRDEALFKSKDFLKVKQSRKLNCELSDRYHLCKCISK